MGKLLYLAIVVIDVIVVMDILRSKKSVEKKVLWTVAVIFLPVLGALLYFFVGRK